MSPSNTEPNLKDILSTTLVQANGGSALKHKLMQLSVFTYLERTKDVEWVEMEHPLMYIGPQTLYSRKSKKKLKRRHDHSQKKAQWPVDIAVVYREGNKKVCELIEVETINLVEFWERLENISMKVQKVEEISRNKQLNWILQNVDEIRFSLAMNASGLDDGLTQYLTDEFKKRFSGVSPNGEVKSHNLYVLRGNIYEYCPKDLNSLMLDNLTPGYSMRSDYKGPLRPVVTATYQKIRGLSLAELDKLYKVSQLA